MKLAVIRDLFPGIPSENGPFFRMTNEAYGGTIDDLGPSFIYGGRYNVKDEFGVLYLSSSAQCAFSERLRQVRGRKNDLLPQVIATFEVKIQKCLNLFEEKVRKEIGIVLEDLTKDSDFSTPQSISREARTAGFEALIAPSAVGKECQTLVVFKDRLEPPSYCTLKKDSIKPFVSN